MFSCPNSEKNNSFFDSPMRFYGVVNFRFLQNWFLCYVNRIGIFESDNNQFDAWSKIFGAWSLLHPPCKFSVLEVENSARKKKPCEVLVHFTHVIVHFTHVIVHFKYVNATSRINYTHTIAKHIVCNSGVNTSRTIVL